VSKANALALSPHREPSGHRTQGWVSDISSMG